MQIKSVLVLAVGLASTATATVPANPIVKHVAARAINIDGSFAGLIFKRQSGCPEGYTACGSGCSEGPCCNNDAGLACRTDEVCAEIDGQTGCCPVGYNCGSIRGCQNADGNGCTPGSVNEGVLCCDAAAPLCSTSSNVPYCAAAAPSTVYTVIPAPTTGDAPTSTVYVTSTDTNTITLSSTSNALPTESPTEDTTTLTVTATTATTDTTTDSEIFTIQTSTPTETLEPETSTATLTSTDVVVVPVPTETPEPETSTATLTSTDVVVVPVPTGNATTTISPPQQTGAAGRFGVSGFALTMVVGLAFLL